MNNSSTVSTNTAHIFKIDICFEQLFIEKKMLVESNKTPHTLRPYANSKKSSIHHKNQMLLMR